MSNDHMISTDAQQPEPPKNEAHLNAAEPPSKGEPPAGSAEPAAVPVADNYLYWQKEGGKWADEYVARKKVMPKYHLQELMLADYFLHSAPARVLEFGCGVGRHLSYLHKLPGIEAFGYDQSPTMVQGCLRWTSQEWIDEHITLGRPTGRLPFDDDAFDIVFSAEVLVHVRPEDIEGVLREMLRIAKWQVIHLETSPTYQLASDAHSGCWYHDLTSIYERIGVKCECLPAGFKMHAPYRVVLASERPLYTWSSLLMHKFRQMETDLEEGEQAKAIDNYNRLEQAKADARQAEERAQGLFATIAQRDGQLTERDGQLARRGAELEQAHQLLREAQRALDAERQACADAVAQTGALNAQLAAQNEQIAALTSQLAELSAELERQQARSAELENEVARRAGAEEEWRDAATQAELQSQDLRRRFAELAERKFLVESEAGQNEVRLRRQYHLVKDFISQIQSELSKS